MPTKAAVHGFVAATATGNKGNFAFYGGVGTDNEMGVDIYF
jgi:hypothetical protein